MKLIWKVITNLNFAANPNSLLNTVWLNNGVVFFFVGFRGRQEHASLLLGDLELKKDASGTDYVEFYGMILRRLKPIVCLLWFYQK